MAQPEWQGHTFLTEEELTDYEEWYELGQVDIKRLTKEIRAYAALVALATELLRDACNLGYFPDPRDTRRVLDTLAEQGVGHVTAR